MASPARAAGMPQQETTHGQKENPQPHPACRAPANRGLTADGALHSSWRARRRRRARRAGLVDRKSEERRTVGGRSRRCAEPTARCDNGQRRRAGADRRVPRSRVRDLRAVLPAGEGRDARSPRQHPTVRASRAVPQGVGCGRQGTRGRASSKASSGTCSSGSSRPSVSGSTATRWTRSGSWRWCAR